MRRLVAVLLLFVGALLIVLGAVWLTEDVTAGILMLGAGVLVGGYGLVTM